MAPSLQTTKAEIERFLIGNEPATLCVSGEWGVGKTFLWRSVLDELRRSKRLSVARYSYVSLFGLNSLEDMKSSLFENMEWLDDDATNFAQRGKSGARALAARAKRLSDLAGALPWVGQAFQKARSLYFSLIQNQIICIDDLDRRSKDIDLKDVLGLISFLREQRGCKVALILNLEKLDNRAEFDSLLEKVIETKVILAPSAVESAAIALPGNDPISVALRAHCQLLDIRNIRILKHIERLVRRVDELLVEFSQAVRDQAVHSLTLFGWSKYDREKAPTLHFFKVSSIERHLTRRDNTAISPEDAAWELLLDKYKFSRADEFDLALMNYVETTILDKGAMQTAATNLQEQNRLRQLHGSFEATWDRFHASFDDDEDEVVHALVEGAKKTYEVVPLYNLNETVRLLKDLGRESEATDLLKFFSEKRDEPEYWNPEHGPYTRSPLDPDVSSVVEQKQPPKPTDFDVAAGLIRAGQDYDAETIARLAAEPLQTYVDLISGARGEHLRRLVYSGLEFRRISNASDDMRRVVSLMEEALRIIGRRSRLNARRIQRYGVSLEADPTAEGGS